VQSPDGTVGSGEARAVTGCADPRAGRHHQFLRAVSSDPSSARVARCSVAAPGTRRLWSRSAVGHCAAADRGEARAAVEQKLIRATTAAAELHDAPILGRPRALVAASCGDGAARAAGAALLHLPLIRSRAAALVVDRGRCCAAEPSGASAVVRRHRRQQLTSPRSPTSRLVSARPGHDADGPRAEARSRSSRAATAAVDDECSRSRSNERQIAATRRPRACSPIARSSADQRARSAEDGASCRPSGRRPSVARISSARAAARASPRSLPHMPAAAPARPSRRVPGAAHGARATRGEGIGAHGGRTRMVVVQREIQPHCSTARLSPNQTVRRRLHARRDRAATRQSSRRPERSASHPRTTGRGRERVRTPGRPRARSQRSDADALPSRLRVEPELRGALEHSTPVPRGGLARIRPQP